MSKSYTTEAKHIFAFWDWTPYFGDTAAADHSRRRYTTLRKLKLFLAATSMAAVTAGLGVSPALAHNAAHLYINGVCLEVGSDKSAPPVGQGAPQTATGHLDLIYDPNPTTGIDTSDQYGARFAADQSPALLPGDCP
jgi:hypothetical protein